MRVRSRVERSEESWGNRNGVARRQAGRQFRAGRDGLVLLSDGTGATHMSSPSRSRVDLHRCGPPAVCPMEISKAKRLNKALSLIKYDATPTGETLVYETNAQKYVAYS